jgi:hypothetical protein
MSETHFIPKGTIISGFAGIGKTTAALKYDNVIDLESSQFFFELPDNLTNKHYEKLKGDSSRPINPNGLSDYVDAIIQAKDKYDYVLIAMFPALIEELNNRNIDVQIVLPHIDDIVEYKSRYKNRGNHKHWIDNMIKNWNNYLDPKSPDFITNNRNLKKPIKEPIILNKLCTDPTKPFVMRESLSDIIDGNIRFKPQYIVNQLKKSLADMDVEVEQHVVLKNTIILKYLFETTELDVETYHQVTIGLTPLANNIDFNVKENDVEIIFEKKVDSAQNSDDFSPKFRFFEINSDEDINKLIDLITTLVVNDIHFTKTLQRLEFEELY